MISYHCISSTAFHNFFQLIQLVRCSLFVYHLNFKSLCNLLRNRSVKYKHVHYTSLFAVNQSQATAATHVLT